LPSLFCLPSSLDTTRKLVESPNEGALLFLSSVYCWYLSDFLVIAFFKKCGSQEDWNKTTRTAVNQERVSFVLCKFRCMTAGQ
jgi:hypothetical protein